MVLLRVALMAAVLGGLLGMHVLTAGHDAGGHGALPVPSAGHATATGSGTPAVGHADTTAAPDAAAAPTDHPAPLVPVAASPMGTGTDPGAGACVLFLALGAVVIGLVLIGRRRAGAPGEIGSWLRQLLMSLQRRGPPRSPLHNTLCVIRV